MTRSKKIIYCLVGLILMAYSAVSFYVIFIGPLLLPFRVDEKIIDIATLYACGVTCGIGLLFFLRGLFSRRAYPLLALDQEGGRITISRKALKNIVYTAVESFDGVLEDRVKVRLTRGPKHSCRIKVKVWLGIGEDSTLPAQHEAIRQRVHDGLAATTGVSPRRVDLVFYTPALKHEAQAQGGNEQ